jgi:predicted acetyltransferase
LSAPATDAKVAPMSDERATAPIGLARHLNDRHEPLVVLEPISRDEIPVLQNLYELYAYDFSEHVPLDLKSNGRFDVPVNDRWWTNDDHFPFFIRHGGKLSGFALARRGSRVTDAADVMDLAEFFVVRGARKKSIGTHVAHSLFTTFPGRWEIRVRRTNAGALKFWSRTLERWSGRPMASTAFTNAGIDWELFRIEPPRG